MRNGIHLGLLVLATLSVLVGPARADKRVALVVGNGAYRHALQLPNPPRDAHAIADKLKAMGFEVVEGYDLDQLDTNAIIQKFARSAAGADVGIFYFAGYGMQLQSINYVVPVDAKLEDFLSADFEITKVGFVVDQMSRDVKLKIVLLDASRDAPWVRRWNSRCCLRFGLADMQITNYSAPEGTLIAFADEPNKVALEGRGEHSPFTEALLTNLDANASLSTIMNRVIKHVLEMTQNRQHPWVRASLTREIFLSRAPEAAPTDAATVVGPRPKSESKAPLH